MGVYRYGPAETDKEVPVLDFCPAFATEMHIGEDCKGWHIRGGKS